MGKFFNLVSGIALVAWCLALIAFLGTLGDGQLSRVPGASEWAVWAVGALLPFSALLHLAGSASEIRDILAKRSWNANARPVASDPSQGP